jgi:hypothetical protein
MATYDKTIRVVMGPGGSRVSLTLASEALLEIHADTRKRLESALPPGGVEPAIAETRALAALVGDSVDGMPADAASLSALFLLANDDSMPPLPPDVRRAVDEYREKFKEDVVNESSALCQLEDLPRFFATAEKEAIQSYMERYVLADSDHNVLIRECLLDLDER